MNQAKQKIDLFTYLDYREFLKDWFVWVKKRKSSYSFRVFAKKADLKSHNTVRMVLTGERNLSAESISKFAKALNLNKQETEFFGILVLFNQAKNIEEKNYYHKKLTQCRKYRKLKPLEKDQNKFFSSWVHPIVREMITLESFDGTPQWIAKHVGPPITTQQAQESLDLLERLNLIKKTKSNKWKQTDTIITTGAEVSSLMALTYHQNLLKMIAEQFPEIEPENRDISAINCSVSRSLIPKIKKKIQAFRQEILKMISTDNHSEEALVLSIHLMPMTKGEKGDIK